MFIGTQLFFDPAQNDKENYWHRDIQYNNLTIEEVPHSILLTVTVEFVFRQLLGRPSRPMLRLLATRITRWKSRVLRQHLVLLHAFIVSLTRILAPMR